MKIAGWQAQSLIDYPDQVAAVIFVAGCNWRCHYCHNHQILDVRQNRLPFGRVRALLRRRRHLIDAVVVSGGEPTVYPQIIPLLKSLRKLGLLIKLDTNGSRPDIVQSIVEQGLVDYVALDLKAPPAKHLDITGGALEPVLRTAYYLRTQTRVTYMFRTTVSPRLDEKDLIIIGQKIVNGAPLWQIQPCRTAGAYSLAKIKKMAEKLKPYAQYIVIRNT